MTRVNEDTTFIPKHSSIKFDSENPVKFVQECVEQDGLELTQFILNSFTNKSDLDISLVETLKGLLIRFPSCQQLNWCLPTFKVLFKANTGITSNNNRIILYRKSIIELFDSQIHNLSNSAQSMKDIDVYINLLQSTNDKNLMLSAWGLVLVMFGQSLHRTSHLNELLSLTEATFNSTRLTLRVGSFKAWKRLILNFTFGEHLYNQKRINLILIPIWNCIEFEKSNAVRETCLECFLYLVVQLTKHSPSYDFIQLVIAPLINFNLDLNLLTVFLNLIVKMIQDIGDENNQFGGIIDDYKLFGASTDILLQHIQPIVTVKDWSVSHFELFLRFLRNVLNSSLVLKNLPLDRLWYFIIRYMEWAWNTGSQSFDIITKFRFLI
ncbi:hypothetical protein BC833DRAFT_217851 [Globomyces pollinis-pini]|nr:hypothetical protein BC833DRAFT_217851 [Globomyces pollinis-pini]